MYLFIIEGQIVKPTEYALSDPPFKVIWDSDDDSQKVNAIKAFTFIEFMCSKRRSNPYKDYKEDVRETKIKERLFGNPQASTSEMIGTAMKAYKKHQYLGSSHLRALESAEKGLAEVSKFLNNVDLEERDERDKPIYKPSDITRAVADMDKMVDSINKLRVKVEEDLQTSSRARAGRQINPFEERPTTI